MHMNAHTDKTILYKYFALEPAGNKVFYKT